MSRYDGTESSDALTVIGNLATIYHRQGDLVLAESAYAEAIELRRERFGESAALAAAMNNYAQVLIIRHRLDEAGDQLERATRMMARFNGETSPHYAIMLRSLGLLALSGGELARAEDKLARAEAILLDSVGPEHLFTAIVRIQAALALARRDREAAVATLSDVITQLETMGPPAESHLATALCEQAVVWLDLDRPADALPVAGRCLEIRRARLSEGNWEIAKADALVAAAEYQLGDSAARPTLAANLNVLADTYGTGHPRLAWLEARLTP